MYDIRDLMLKNNITNLNIALYKAIFISQKTVADNLQTYMTEGSELFAKDVVYFHANVEATKAETHFF